MLFGWLKAAALVSLVLIAWVGVGLAHRRGTPLGDDEPSACPGCGCGSRLRAETDHEGPLGTRRWRTDCPPAAPTDRVTTPSPIPTATESE